MALQVTPLDNVGVEVSGFDITRPIDEALAAELVALWNEHAILLFRGQDVNPENQIAFSRVFGELAMHPLAATTSQEYPELFMLVNEPDKEKFMTARYNSHRRIFSTPFWNEGQALYWEMFLWDHDFHVTLIE